MWLHSNFPNSGNPSPASPATTVHGNSPVRVACENPGYVNSPDCTLPIQGHCVGCAKLGWGSHWSSGREVNGDFSCSTAFFGGDPIYGQGKECTCAAGPCDLLLLPGVLPLHPGHNYICQENACSCTGGTAASGANCPAMDEAKCISCNSGHTLVGDSCEVNQCTCADGTAATGNECPTNNVSMCSSCNIGHFLIGGTCEENQCTCTDGTGKVGVHCETNGAHLCASCNSGFDLGHSHGHGGDGHNVCLEKLCTCFGGAGATGTDCPTPGAHKCMSCNPGYTRRGHHCHRHWLHQTTGLAAELPSTEWMQSQKADTHYILAASLLLASFSAMAFATRLFNRGGDDSFVLMTDVEQ